MSESIRFQAHRGVSAECPENTIPAFRRAVAQKYGIIELDPAFTSDGVCVILHDRTVNRTARNADGTALSEEKEISGMTYAEAKELDYGLWFSEKYRGAALPTLSEVLSLAESAGVTVKLDNKVENFTEAQRERLFETVAESRAKIAFTCKSVEFAALTAKKFPAAEIHYDGPVSPAVLRKLHAAVNKTRLTVWLRYGNAETSWSSLPPADEAKCGEVKKYASLGIWKISQNDEFRKAAYVFEADVIETNGRLKPPGRAVEDGVGMPPENSAEAFIFGEKTGSDGTVPADPFDRLDAFLDRAYHAVRTLGIDALEYPSDLARDVYEKCEKESFEPYADKIREVLREMISRGIPLGIGGSDGAAFDPAPVEALLRLYRSLGGYLVTLLPGAPFEKLRTALLSHGFEDAYYFKGRDAVQYSVYRTLQDV